MRPSLRSHVRRAYALDLLETAILAAPLSDVLRLAAGEAQRDATGVDAANDLVATVRPEAP